MDYLYLTPVCNLGRTFVRSLICNASLLCICFAIAKCKQDWNSKSSHALQLKPWTKWPSIALLPWEDEEDEHGDAGRQNDLCFCVELPVTARGSCPVLHHAPAPAPRPALLAQETPKTVVFHHQHIKTSISASCEWQSSRREFVKLKICFSI